MPSPRASLAAVADHHEDAAVHTPAPVQITLSAPAPGPFGEIDSGILKVRAAAVPEG